jgi:hypothetical protein
MLLRRRLWGLRKFRVGTYAPVFMFMMFTNCREHAVVAQNRGIISSGITIIARMVRSSLSTGIRRSATICSRVPIHHRSTWTCTTSTTGRKTTSLKTRPTRTRLVLCPRLRHRPRLLLVRPIIWLLPKPKPPRLCLQRRKSRLHPPHIHRNPRMSRLLQVRPLHIHRNPWRRSPLHHQVRTGLPRPGLTRTVPLTPKRMRPSLR